MQIFHISHSILVNFSIVSCNRERNALEVFLTFTLTFGLFSVVVESNIVYWTSDMKHKAYKLQVKLYMKLLNKL